MHVIALATHPYWLVTFSCFCTWTWQRPRTVITQPPTPAKLAGLVGIWLGISAATTVQEAEHGLGHSTAATWASRSAALRGLTAAPLLEHAYR